MFGVATSFFMSRQKGTRVVSPHCFEGRDMKSTSRHGLVSKGGKGGGGGGGGRGGRRGGGRVSRPGFGVTTWPGAA